MQRRPDPGSPAVARKMAPYGDLIVVTGPSGVGKSTVTEQLHDRLGGDWLLWQSDLCSPRRHPRSAARAESLTREEQVALEGRMFAANLDSIAAYLNNDWPVVAELSIMNATEANELHKISTGRVALVQLGCSPETLAAHLQQRDTGVPADWAVEFYERWRNVDLPGAVHVEVDGRTVTQVVDQILHRLGRV